MPPDSALDLNGVSPGAVFHDFGSGVTGNRITRDSTLPIILHWADPVGESANDYDLFLIDSDNNVLASSTSTQDGTQDPIEYIGGSCNDDREDARLVIVKNTGALDRYVRLNYVRGELEIATAGQTYGHSASQDAIGVAAVDVRTAGGQSRRLRRDGVGRDIQFGRASAYLLRSQRHADHAGELLVHWRACVAKTGPGRGRCGFDLDSRLFNVPRHLGGGASRGGNRGIGAGGGGRSGQRHGGRASHGDDRVCTGYRGDGRR